MLLDVLHSSKEGLLNNKYSLVMLTFVSDIFFDTSKIDFHEYKIT